LDSLERPGPYSNRAALLLEIGRPEEALRDYRSALKCDPENQSYVGKIAELQSTAS
jgi:Flp pilus assembly protein TadD